jgi:hypothetical protein
MNKRYIILENGKHTMLGTYTNKTIADDFVNELNERHNKKRKQVFVKYTVVEAGVTND